MIIISYFLDKCLSQESKKAVFLQLKTGFNSTKEFIHIKSFDMKSNIFSAFMLLLAAIVGMAFITTDVQTKPWPVPDKYKKMENPVKYDKKSAAALWTKHCKSCHGKDGLGDGPKAAQLDTPSGDFTTATFQKQPDGALFYKTLEGRDDMPAYKKKIPDQEDIWNLVHYMREFK